MNQELLFASLGVLTALVLYLYFKVTRLELLLASQTNGTGGASSRANGSP